jgi:hypothetical protein
MVSTDGSSGGFYRWFHRSFLQKFFSDGVHRLLLQTVPQTVYKNIIQWWCPQMVSIDSSIDGFYKYFSMMVSDNCIEGF